mgnify:CR=1 FL=1
MSKFQKADGWKWELVQTRKKILEEEAKERISEGWKKGNEIRWKKESPGSNIDTPDKKGNTGRVRQQLFNELGLGSGK